mgnify:CR=1 FL=1
MNIAYHSSDSYSSVLGTSIASLLVNNINNDEINIYVIEENISQINKERLLQLVEQYGRKLQFIPMPDMNKMQNLGLKAVRSDWIFNSYCRLYLDQILPSHVKRVLYLDCDVLVMDDLSELWNIDLNGKVMAAVADCLGESYYKMLGLSDTARYCNSGVQLQDLEAWRCNHVGDLVRNYIHKSGGYIFFMEQTAVNVVLQDKIFVLPPQYNVNTLIQTLTYKQLLLLRHPKRYYSEQMIQSALDKPKIIHLTSTFLISNRAWFDRTNHPMKEMYNEYKKMTPWKECLEFKDNRKLFKKIIQYMIDFFPRNLLLIIVGIIYNSLRVANIKRLMKKAKRNIGKK